MAEANKIPIPEGYEPLLEQYDLFLNAQNLASNTIISYTIQFKKLIHTLNAIESDENQEQTVEQQKKNLQRTIELVLSQSKNSPGVVRSAIRSILNFMKYKKGVDVSGIDIPKHKGHRTREIHKCPIDYIRKMLPLIKREDDNLMVRLTRKFVLRSDEAVHLRVNSFNFPRKMLKIIGKGNVEVNKPMIDDVFIKVIRDYIKYRLPKYDREDIAQKKDWMFPRIAKLTHPTRHFRYIMEWVGKQLDDTYRVHEIRHGAATDLHNAGMDLRVLQKFMGHKSITSTAIYAEPSQAKIEEQVAMAEHKMGSIDPVDGTLIVDDVSENAELSDNDIDEQLEIDENINEDTNS